jgi:hypothetical protein
MEKIDRLDVCAEMAYIDFELEALLESHPEIAQGHEKDLEDLGLVNSTSAYPYKTAKSQYSNDY